MSATRQQAAKAAEPKEPTPETSFEPFSRLPPNVRQEVWRAACSQPTSTPGVCFLTKELSKMPKPGEVPCLSVQEAPNANILSTNTEAHDMVLMSDTPTRAYDPARDILFVTDDAFENFTCQGHRNGPEWLTAIQHLAITLKSTNSLSNALPIAMARLTSLETLSVVYPAPSGTFDWIAAIEGPADKSTPLRRLTGEELAGLTVTADYVYYTWAGDFPICWTKSGPEHMEQVEAVLDKECNPRNSGSLWNTPLWDPEAKRLGIRYDARCFEARPTPRKFHS